ncbi:MAG: undecaprenyl-diphosphatase [Paracoccaceae bacterium]|jgi:undecaprenyl-diphosphatase
MDEFLLSTINGFARASPELDFTIGFISDSYIFKGMVPVAVFCFLWFAAGPSGKNERSGVLATGVLTVAAIIAARLLSTLMPLRLRPIHDPSAADIVNIPYSISPTYLEGWSAMPSDHAVMFAALAVSTFIWHRTAGTLLLAHAAIVVSLPRVFLGLHWPSDILVGWLFGAIFAIVLTGPLMRVIRPLLDATFSRRAIGLFYCAGFLIAFQMASTFESARELGKALWILLL